MDGRGLDQVLQELTGEEDLLALPAIVLTPVPGVDTLTYLACSFAQRGIQSPASPEIGSTNRGRAKREGVPRPRNVSGQQLGGSVCTAAFLKLKETLRQPLLCKRRTAPRNEALATFSVHNVHLILRREFKAGAPAR